MKVLKKEDKMFFNNNDVSFGNVSVKNDVLFLEIIKTLPAFRNLNYATNTLLGILSFVKRDKNIKKFI